MVIGDHMIISKLTCRKLQLLILAKTQILFHAKVLEKVYTLNLDR